MKIRALDLSILFLFLAIPVCAQDGAPPPPAKQPLAIAAPSPAPVSLKTLPAAQRYTAVDKTFAVWMPAKPKSETITPPVDPAKGLTRTQVKWELAEGFFAVSRSKYQQRSFDTEEDVATLFKMIKESVTADPETKFVSEKFFTSGKWRGAEMVFSSGDWIKTIVRIHVSGKEVYVVLATVSENVPEAEKLLLKAMDSFEIKQS
jgi:hypothetical protein